MSKEYIFWFQVTNKLAFSFFWNIPKQLVKVVVSDSNINSDGPIWLNSQDTLAISLPDIAQIKLVISPTGNVGTVEIITQESKHHLLVPTNPFDPTLLSHSNVDEIIAFISIVKALKAKNTPDLDENPYVRQLQKDDRPTYLNNKDFLWDKNVSPWEYYYKFVPASVDSKKRLTVKIYKIIVLGALSVMAFVALYAIFVQLVK